MTLQDKILEYLGSIPYSMRHERHIVLLVETAQMLTATNGDLRPGTLRMLTDRIHELEDKLTALTEVEKETA